MINLKKIISSVKEAFFKENIDEEERKRKSKILFKEYKKAIEEAHKNYNEQLLLEEESDKIDIVNMEINEINKKLDKEFVEVKTVPKKDCNNILIYKIAFEPDLSLVFRKEIGEQCKKVMIKSYDLLYRVPVVNLIQVLKKGNYDVFSRDSKIVMNLIKNGVDFIEITIEEF